MNLNPLWLDLILGIDTARDFHRAGRARSSWDHLHYCHTPSNRLWSALGSLSSFRSLSIDSGTFVDAGCGKGRSLIVAALFGFTKIIGIERSKILAEIAQRNIATCLDVRNNQNTRLFQADLEDYRDFKDAAVILLDLPEMGRSFDRLIENILDSTTSNRRKPSLLVSGIERTEDLRKNRKLVMVGQPALNYRDLTIFEERI